MYSRVSSVVNPMFGQAVGIGSGEMVDGRAG